MMIDTGMKHKFRHGMVFGVFDLFHPGHAYFLREALKHCEHLIVVVTVPEVVANLKQVTPKDSLQKRMNAISFFSERITAVKGDSVLGEWKVLQEYSVDIIFLGYDQQGIAKELDQRSLRYRFLSSYQPEKYKSSLLAEKSGD